MQEVEIRLQKEERHFNERGEVRSTVLTFGVYRGNSYVGTVEMNTWGNLDFDLTISLSVPFLKQIIPQLEEYLILEGE